MAASPGLNRVLEELGGVFGDRLTTARSVRDLHGDDPSPLDPAPPDAVAFPTTTEEVSRIVGACNRHAVPVVAFGAGTSLEGHVLATSGGISLDLGVMDRILGVRVDDLDATVQAGVTKDALNEQLGTQGLFFPVDPGADATLGGMAATGASGTTTVRYGTMRDNVLSLTVVLADGTVVQTARRARKSSAGYDLTRLFVGSEGTLGIITELTLRVRGLPESIETAVCSFPDVGAAIAVVISILQLGVPVARLEFVDELAIDAINKRSGLDHPVAPLLLLEFHGSERETAEQSRTIRDLAMEMGALEFRAAADAQERSALWRARHESFHATLALRPGARAVTTDVCVPISALPECIDGARASIKELGLLASIVGHVGDGNFHVQALIDPGNPRELERAEEMNRRLVDHAMRVGGTCTGEHGIGLRKIAFLEQELPEGVRVMRAIKNALDPNGILNPGKVLRRAAP